MKLIDIAEKIDKSKRNESSVCITDFNYEFNCEFDYVEQDRLKAYWIGNWQCTDTWVGTRLYFFDNKPVAVSTQSGRKSDENFGWFSKEVALEVRDYFLSLMTEKNINFTVVDINADIGDSYKIEFNNCIINQDKATLNGQPIKILERVLETPNYGIDTRLKIETAEGELKEVEIEELDFKFNLV